MVPFSSVTVISIGVWQLSWPSTFSRRGMGLPLTISASGERNLISNIFLYLCASTFAFLLVPGIVIPLSFLPSYRQGRLLPNHCGLVIFTSGFASESEN
jgi:hypothetical protein